MSSKFNSGIRYAYMHGGAAWGMLTGKRRYGVICSCNTVWTISECIRGVHEDVLYKSTLPLPLLLLLQQLLLLPLLHTLIEPHICCQITIQEKPYKMKNKKLKNIVVHAYITLYTCFHRNSWFLSAFASYNHVGTLRKHSANCTYHFSISAELIWKLIKMY